MKHVHKTYKQLHKVATERYEDKGMCGVIAVAIAGRVSYGRAKSITEKLGRKHRQGTPVSVIEKAIAETGHDMVVLSDPPATIGSLAKAEPEGIFVALNAGGKHITAIRNGVIEDWAKDSPRKRIVKAWKVVAVQAQEG